MLNGPAVYFIHAVYFARFFYAERPFPFGNNRRVGSVESERSDSVFEILNLRYPETQPHPPGNRRVPCPHGGVYVSRTEFADYTRTRKRSAYRFLFSFSFLRLILYRAFVFVISFHSPFRRRIGRRRPIGAVSATA